MLNQLQRGDEPALLPCRRSGFLRRPDLMAVLEGRIDLVQLLLRKRRKAAETGNIYLRIHEIL
jgi:hypothetical protein